ncbi:MAG: phage tail assembly protein [Pseudohongiella sp.]|nr:phage tail assembly protein [Pseudohongiella sp.]
MSKNTDHDDLHEQDASEITKAGSIVPTTTIELDTPIARAGKPITHVDLRKPLAGALRGVTLVDVMQMDVMALTRVLPRITTPALTDSDIRAMDPADLVQLGAALSDFLTAKKFQAAPDQK